MSAADQQAERLGSLRRRCDDRHRGVNGRSMLAFLKGDVVRLCEEVARTSDNPDTRRLALELATEAKRIKR